MAQLPADVSPGDGSHDDHHDALHGLYNHMDTVGGGDVTAAWTAEEENKLAAISGTNTGDEPAATVSNPGIIEIASMFEINAGSDAERAITPAGLAGSNLTNAVFTNSTKVSATTANVNAAGAVMNTDTSTSPMDFVVDEDTMSSNSSTKVPTQQSVKAYVDAEVAGVGGGRSVTASTLSSAGDATITRAAADQTHTLTLADDCTGITRSWTEADILQIIIVGSGSTSNTIDLSDYDDTEGGVLSDSITVYPDTVIDITLQQVAGVVKTKAYDITVGTLPTASLIAAGTILHGGTLPATIVDGDTIYLCGHSQHNDIDNKAMTAPAGYTGLGGSLSPYNPGPFNPDHHWVKKTASSDASAAVTFGGEIGTASIDYFVVRNGTGETLGTGASAYSVTTVTLPTVAQAGIHLVSFTMSGVSGDNSVPGAAPASYTEQGDQTPGYGRSASYTRTSAPNPTGNQTMTTTVANPLAATSIVAF